MDQGNGLRFTMEEDAMENLGDGKRKVGIKVVGVGGAGGNAVNRMIAAGLQDVDFIVINTDAQALKNSPSPRRLQIGLEITAGLGSGGKPEVGHKAAL